MFKLPSDLIIKLKPFFEKKNEIKTETEDKKIEENILNCVNTLFHNILANTLENGTTTVREFGRFEAYKVFSTKLGKDVIRFKFKMASPLNKKLQDDSFIMNKLERRDTVPFTEVHEQKCQDKKDQKQINYEARQNAVSLGQIKTKEAEAKLAIMELIND